MTNTITLQVDRFTAEDEKIPQTLTLSTDEELELYSIIDEAGAWVQRKYLRIGKYVFGVNRMPFLYDDEEFDGEEYVLSDTDYDRLCKFLYDHDLLPQYKFKHQTKKEHWSYGGMPAETVKNVSY